MSICMNEGANFVDKQLRTFAIIFCARMKRQEYFDKRFCQEKQHAIAHSQLASLSACTSTRLGRHNITTSCHAEEEESRQR